MPVQKEAHDMAFTDTERLIGRQAARTDAAKNQVAMNPTNTLLDAKCFKAIIIHLLLKDTSPVGKNLFIKVQLRVETTAESCLGKEVK